MNVRDIISVSHLVHCELCTADNKPRLLDLSVFGTPAGVSDEDIIEGWSVENLAYMDVSIVTELGRHDHNPDCSILGGCKDCYGNPTAVTGLGLQSTVDRRIGLRGLPEGASVTGLGRCSFIYIYILSPRCK